MLPPVWTFTTPPIAPRHPHIMLVAFSRGPLRTDVPLSLETAGVPDAAALDGLDLRSISRAADPGWFDGWRSGALRAIADGDLGRRAADLDAADHVHLVMAAPEGPGDLGYLQTAWAVIRHHVACGATIVLDVHAATFRLGTALPGPTAALDVRAEVRVVFETDSTRSDNAHALHTRGLRKFGAPDLVALCGDADAQVVANVVLRLAELMARGTDLAAPRHRVELDTAAIWYVVADEHGLGELLELNNEARVLVDGEGRHLIGVASRPGSPTN